MAKENLTKSFQIQLEAREIDFVTRFTRNWDHLREILGIMRPIKKQPGVVLKSKIASVALENGNVGEGEEIPYSQASVKEVPYKEMGLKKYAKAVSIEAIKEHGYDAAVGLTDDAFLYELQEEVTREFYEYLATGTLTKSESNWQRALAMAKGLVINKFKQIHRTATGVVGFVNVLDLYDYLGGAEITVQTDFGFQYIKNFMGYNTVFLLSDEEIPQGRVIATPVDNIVLYYVDPSASDFARAGLPFTTDGETNLIGFHAQGNYSTAVSECYAIMGLTLYAEYLDAIALVDVESTADTISSLTVTSTAGTATGSTALTVDPAKSSGNVYKYKVGATAIDVAKGQNVRTWSTWDGTSDITATNGDKITLVEAGSDYKAIGAGVATVTAKS